MSKLNDTDSQPQTQQEVPSKQTDDNGLPQEIPMPTCDFDDEGCGVCQ